MLIILRYSGQILGGPDVNLLGPGTVVGFLIILTAVLISYVTTGGGFSSLEFMFNITGIALFLATGILALQQGRDSAIAVGILSLVTGLVFIVELIFLNKAKIVGKING